MTSRLTRLTNILLVKFDMDDHRFEIYHELHKKGQAKCPKQVGSCLSCPLVSKRRFKQLITFIGDNHE